MPGFCCESDSVVLQNTQCSQKKSSISVCRWWQHGLWEGCQRRRNTHEDCESTSARLLWSPAAQMWSAGTENLRWHLNTFETIYKGVPANHILAFSGGGGGWRITFLCCSASARVAYSADIGSQPRRFNRNVPWQVWQLNKNTLLKLTKPLFHRPAPPPHKHTLFFYISALRSLA